MTPVVLYAVLGRTRCFRNVMYANADDIKKLQNWEKTKACLLE